MAHLETTGLEDILKKLENLSDQSKVEAIAKKSSGCSAADQ